MNMSRTAGYKRKEALPFMKEANGAIPAVLQAPFSTSASSSPAASELSLGLMEGEQIEQELEGLEQQLATLEALTAAEEARYRQIFEEAQRECERMKQEQARKQKTRKEKLELLKVQDAEISKEREAKEELERDLNELGKKYKHFDMFKDLVFRVAARKKEYLRLEANRHKIAKSVSANPTWNNLL